MHYVHGPSGTIPSEVGLAHKLLQFRIAGSYRLSGTVPAALSNASDALTLLQLQWNDALSGTIPSEVGLLSKLTQLRLYGQRTSGLVPSQLGMLSSLNTNYGCQLGGASEEEDRFACPLPPELPAHCKGMSGGNVTC